MLLKSAPAILVIDSSVDKQTVWLAYIQYIVAIFFICGLKDICH